ncbi:MAG: hypothetical protein K2N81_05745 [Acetatifactor sp.]|nr:hypothetical protein [Acetatifactor sp.]
MKNKILTLVCTLMLFVPWTILPLRTNAWALESPVAEIMIASYAVFMILGGIFTMIAYVKAHAQNTLMKLCLVMNGMYAVGGAAALAMMIIPRMM